MAEVIHNVCCYVYYRISRVFVFDQAIQVPPKGGKKPCKPTLFHKNVLPCLWLPKKKQLTVAIDKNEKCLEPTQHMDRALLLGLAPNTRDRGR